MAMEIALVDPGPVDLAIPIPVAPEPIPAQPPPTSAVTVAWEKYCSELGERVKKDFESKACNGMAEYLEVLERACQTSQDESLGFKVLDWFEPLFKLIELFVPAASAAIQAYPNPGSLVLGGIVGLLQITSRVTAYQRLSVQMLDRMGRKARILRDYERDLYSGDVAVHEALVRVYGDMLRFCHKAVTFLTDDGTKLQARVRGLKLILFRDFSSKLGPIVENFEQHIEDVESQASLCDKRRLKALSDRQQARDYDVSQAVAEFRDHARRQDDLRIQLKKRQDAFEEEVKRRERREDMKQALSWLSPLNFNALYEERCQDQLEGTGSWLLASEEYKTWKRGSGSDLLWITGKPGCGKSFLAAVAVNDLETEVKETTALAFALCQRTEAANQSSEAILGSLAKQIIAGDAAIDEELVHQYSTAQDGEKPTQRKIDLIMNSALSKRSRTFLVIDALDECKDLLKLSEALIKYVQDKDNASVKVLVLSRHDFDLENRFKPYPRLHPDLGANEVDLKAYIESLFTDETQTDRTKEIRDECIAKADGMFLWVKLLEQTLQRSLQVRNSRGAISRRVLETIKEIPPGLGSMYDRILQDIWDMRHSRSDAFMVLLWVTHAKRPLFRTEMLDAVADYRDVTDLSDKFTQPSPEHLVAICANLVYIDKDGYFRLCHESVRGHLDNEPDEMTRPLREYQNLKRDAEERLAKICLDYMLLDNFKSGPPESINALHVLVQEGPFISYSAGNWGYHVAQMSAPSVQDLVMEVVNLPARRELSMQVCLYTRNDQSRLWKLPGTTNPLHVLSMFGLKQVAETLSDVVQLAQEADGTGTTPFSYALKRGHHDMCMWLIEKANAIQSLLPTRTAQIEALSFCIIFGWTDIAKVLISHDATLVDALDKDGRTPLVTACLFGMKEVAKALIESGANVNLVDDSGDNPLITAAIVGEVGVVKLLLDSGAEPNCVDKDKWSPLSCACTADNVPVATILLERGADTLAEMPDKQSPFHVAARFNSTKVIKVLNNHPVRPPLDMRASYPDAESTPLHVAAWNNSYGVAEELVKIGAPPNEVDCEKQTPLFIAAARGYQETVDVLIKAGTDIEIPDNTGLTAIHAASSSGNLPVLLHILESQTRVEKWSELVNHKSTDGRTPLHTAVHGGNPEVIRTLIKAGADAKAVYPVSGGCALHTAASRGEAVMARILLEATREANPQNLDQETPLHMAAKEGKTDFIKQFLDCCEELKISVDLELLNHKKRTPFGEAVASGCEAVANLLLAKASQSPSICDVDGNYPIHHAAYHGYENIVEALLTHEGVTHKGYLGRTPLYFAATQGHLGILRMLATPPHNTTLNEPGDKGLTPILSAMLNGHYEAVELILDNQPTRTIFEGVADNGDKLLHVAATAGNLKLARRFMNFGCDAVAPNQVGFTPMHCAVASDQLEIVGHLLANGVDTVNTPTTYGSVCNMFAAEKGNLEMLLLLEVFGATYGNHDSVGRSAAHYAANLGQWAALDYLRLRGERLDEKDLEGHTPLMLAASEGYSTTVRSLLSPEAGPLDEVNLVGETALTQAVTMDRPAVIDLLIAQGANPNHRDHFGLSPFDYASRRPVLLKHLQKGRIPMENPDQEIMNRILSETIQDLCGKILRFPENPTVPQRANRAFDSFNLSKALGHVRDYEAANVCLLEALWPSESFSPFLNFRCDLCNRGGADKPTHICKSCLPWTGICTPCHEDYVQAKKKLPTALQELKLLEAQVHPLRKAIPEGVEILAVAEACFYFAAGQAWVQEMLKLYRQWEQSHNSSKKYREVSRPGQEFVKILADMYTLLRDVTQNENGVTSEDRERFTTLKDSYRSHLRVFPIDKEPTDFICADHEFISVTKDDFEKAKGPNGSLDPESGLMTSSFLEGLIAKYAHNAPANGNHNDSSDRDPIESPARSRHPSRASTWNHQTVRTNALGEVGPRRGSVRRPSQVVTHTHQNRQTETGSATVPSDAEVGANGAVYRLQSNNPTVLRRTKTLPIRLDKAEVVTAHSFAVGMKGTQAFNALQEEPDAAEGSTQAAPANSQQSQSVERTVTVSYVHEASAAGQPTVAGAQQEAADTAAVDSASDGAVLGTTLTNEPEAIDETTPAALPGEITSVVAVAEDQDAEGGRNIDQEIMRAYITVNDSELNSPEEMLAWWLALKLTTAMVPGFIDLYVRTHQARARQEPQTT